MKRILYVFIMTLAPLAFISCNEDEGTAERITIQFGSDTPNRMLAISNTEEEVRVF